METEDESLPQDALKDTEGTDSEDPGTFFVPSAAVGKKVKAGDTLTFKVVGMDSEGDIEVTLSGSTESDSGGDFVGDMKKMFRGGSNG